MFDLFMKKPMHDPTEVDGDDSFAHSLNTDRMPLLGSSKSDAASEEDIVNPHEYKLYARRWLMLSMFATVGLMNNAMWIFFAPFPITASQFYGVSTNYIDFLSATFM